MGKKGKKQNIKGYWVEDTRITVIELVTKWRWSGCNFSGIRHLSFMFLVLIQKRQSS